MGCELFVLESVIDQMPLASLGGERGPAARTCELEPETEI